MAGDVLKRLLVEKVRDAFIARDCVQKLDELKGEAHVWLYITAAREFHFCIWRAKQYPSESEWITFLRHLPPEILPPGPLPRFEQFAPRGRKVLKAHWRLSKPNPFGESDNEQKPPHRLADHASGAERRQASDHVHRDL